MAYQEPISPIELKGWTGGLNREADPYQLDATEVPDCINVDFGLRGSVSKRKGYMEHLSGTDVGIFITTWEGRVVAVEDDATNLNVMVDSGAALSDSTENLGTSPTIDRDYSVATAAMNDYLYVTRHDSTLTNPLRWDGTTWTTMTHAEFDGTASRFPRARTLVAAHERIFAFNVHDDTNGSQASRMHWSNPADPEQWDALDWIDFAPDDGTEITGAVLFGEQILVFKETSIFALAGTDEETFTVYPVDSALGTYAPLTITNVGPELYFFDHLTGVHSFDGSQFKRRDDKINTYLLEGVNSAVIYKAVGFAYRGRWYLSVPWGTDTENSRTFAYDPRIDAWTEYDYGFASAALDEAMPLAVGVRDVAGVMELFSGVDDDGSNITSYVKTGWLAPTSPSVKHRIRRLDLTLSALGDHDITVTMRRDFVTDAYKTKVINTDPGGSVYGTGVYGTDVYGLGSEQVLSRTTGWGDRWRVVQFQFEENTNGEFQVNRLVMQTSSSRRTRGAH